MKPFRRFAQASFFSTLNNPDTGRQVVKALERQPLMPNEAPDPNPFPGLIRCQRGSPITFNDDRILKFGNLPAYRQAGLPVSFPLFSSLDDLKKWGGQECLSLPTFTFEWVKQG